ncbi:MAG: hypothetical protein SPD82_04435, partial [Prevotella sp.]|nr:hypothetical protein [Prevotella sp.]
IQKKYQLFIKNHRPSQNVTINAPKDTNFKAQISIFTKCKRIGIIPYILTFHFPPLHFPFFRWQGSGIPLFVLLLAVF